MLTRQQWTLEKAREVIADVQMPVRAFGFHVALGGGVLNNGVSYKDLDLYFLPLDDMSVPANFDGLKTFLNGIWGASEPLIDPRYGPSVYYYDKLKFMHPEYNRRIDVFITGVCHRAEEQYDREAYERLQRGRELDQGSLVSRWLARED